MGQDHVIAIIGCILVAILLIGLTISIVNKSDSQTGSMMEKATSVDTKITGAINDLAS